MLTKDQLLDSIATEIRVIRHLANKLDSARLDWRPTSCQRSTIELLRYLSTAGTALTRAMVRGSWDLETVVAETPRTLEFAEFDAAMARQDAAIRELLRPFSEDDLRRRPAQMPDGRTTNLGAALVDVVLRVLGGYRMQLFLYAKGSGNHALSTLDCWYGVDGPPA